MCNSASAGRSDTADWHLLFLLTRSSLVSNRGEDWDGHAHSAPHKSAAPLTPGAVARLKGQLEARIDEERRSRSVEPRRSASPSPMVRAARYPGVLALGCWEVIFGYSDMKIKAPILQQLRLAMPNDKP